jgi:hypothetical protein
MTGLAARPTTFGVCGPSAIAPFADAEVCLIAASAPLPRMARAGWPL